MSERLKIIAIDALRVGMLVVKLDVSWLESPFLSHTRAIREPADIQALRDAGVKTVTIDLSRGVDVDSSAQANDAPPPAVKPRVSRFAGSIANSPNNQKAEKDQEQESPGRVLFEKEWQAAVNLRKQIKKSVESITLALEHDLPLPVDEMTSLVETTLDSLARNDQALMALVHLSRKAQPIADHVFGTFCLVLNLSVLLGVSKAEREQLGLAALLHEAGWTQLPLNLLGKRARYTPAEISLIRKHTLIGGRMLENSGLSELTRRLVAEHHEHLDGSGYPHGLKADQLHPLSQLLRVADEYEERVHQLTDEPGMIPTLALRSLYQQAGNGVFDIEVVAALISLLGIYPPTTAVLLNTGEKALVKEHHRDKPLNPTIMIFYDADGRPLHRPLEIDLRQQSGEEQRVVESAVDLMSPGHEGWRQRLAAEELFHA